MRPSPARVAYRHLMAAPSDQMVQTVRNALATATTRVNDLIEQAELMERLIAKGEARRLGRTSDIGVGQVRFDGKQINAKMHGTTDNYDTRITLRPRPGHHCTCPDWARNGVRVGPCKHVLKLGHHWRDEKVIPGLEEIANSLVGTLF